MSRLPASNPALGGFDGSGRMLLSKRSVSILCRRELRRRSFRSQRLRISNAVGESATGVLHSPMQATLSRGLMRSPPRSFKIEFKNRSAKSAALASTTTEDHGKNISKPSFLDTSDFVTARSNRASGCDAVMEAANAVFARNVPASLAPETRSAFQRPRGTRVAKPYRRQRPSGDSIGGRR